MEKIIIFSLLLRNEPNWIISILIDLTHNYYKIQCANYIYISWEYGLHHVSKNGLTHYVSKIKVNDHANNPNNKKLKSNLPSCNFIIFLMKYLSILLIKDHKYKALQNHNHMLWGYIIIDTNKILTIKCYLWLSSSSNPRTKIVK
jgi:hypothetical protein